MRRWDRTLVWGALCILTLAYACGDATSFGPAPSGSAGPPPDAGQDAGQTPEAGNGDAGADAGLPPDGGAPPDAGAGPDAGPPVGTRIQVPPSGHLYHGVFPAGLTNPDAGPAEPDSDVSLDAADEYSDAVGRPLAYIYFSNEWFVSKAFPRVTAEGIRARGAIPFIRLHMRSQSRQLVADPLYTLDNINAGMFDADLRAWADGAKAFGTALIVQYGTEVNGDWNPWSAKYNGGYDVGPGKFRQAFRHIVEVMRAEGASNITWALHLNEENWPGDQPNNNAGAYYPGDDVVDWIGFSMYQNYGVNDPRCRDIGQLLADREAELGAAATTKPLFFFELGTSATSPQCDPGTWLRQTLTDLLDGHWPEIHGFAWWDESTWDGSFVMSVPGEPLLQQPFHDVLNGPLGPHLQDRPIVH